MSAIITDEITESLSKKNAIQRRKLERKPSLFDRLNIKGKYENHKLAKVWAWRNHDHGEVFATSLEVDYIAFNQHILTEETPEIVAKLTRIGFVHQVGFPDEEQFKDFARVMYNKKHNIAITLYQPKKGEAIKTAYEIMKKTQFDGTSGMVIFLAALDVLFKK